MQLEKIYTETEIDEKLEQVEQVLDIIEHQQQARTFARKLTDWLKQNQIQILYAILSTICLIVFIYDQNKRLERIEHKLIELENQLNK